MFLGWRIFSTRWKKLPESSLIEILDLSKTDAITGLPEVQRLPLWTKLLSLVRKHKRHSDAHWALPTHTVELIDQVATEIAPHDPSVAHRILFRRNTRDLYDYLFDWRKNEELLAQQRRDSITEIFARGGIAAVTAFAGNVENAALVGFALSQLEASNIDVELLPDQVLSPDAQKRDLVRGYVCAMFDKRQWDWFDSLDIDGWSVDQITMVLTYLPFESQTWHRAAQLLPEDGKLYWTHVPIHRMRGDSDYVAVDALMRHGRAACGHRLFD